jgi:GNAT superfamily N-acetyltransferase
MGRPAGKAARSRRLSVAPLDERRWADFVSLLGERGGCGGCWCMAWRLPRASFEKQKGDGNRRAMKKLVRRGDPVGLIAYDGETPAAWLSVAPRGTFVKLASSRVLKPIDDTPVWSISCFFVAKEYRGKGLSSEILELAAAYYAKKGVRVLEGYPVIPYSAKMPAPFAWTGFLSAFLKAGFRKEKSWSKARPIVRRYSPS